MPLRILVIGGGAAESALIWKLATCRQVDQVVVVAGNAGTATLNPNKVVSIDHIKLNDLAALLQLVEIMKIHLVIPGSSVPVDSGIESYFRKMKIACFAPTKAAAQIQSSRSFAKSFTSRYNIPTIKSETFQDYDAAIAYIESWPSKQMLTITASDLHQREITMTKSQLECLETLTNFRKACPGTTKGSVTIQEHIEGDELCVLVISDEEGYKMFPPVQICAGGTGCYSPCELITANGQAAIDTQIIRRTLEGLKSDGTGFRGFLTPTILITSDGPRLKSYTTPHSQLVIATMVALLDVDVDLSAIILNCCNRRIQCSPIRLMQRYTCSVVLRNSRQKNTNPVLTTKDMPPALQDLVPLGEDLAAGFYCERGSCHLLFFHHHTRFLSNHQKTTDKTSLNKCAKTPPIAIAGPERVMIITAVATTLEKAVETAHQATRMIDFRGLSYDRSVGLRGLEIEECVKLDRDRLERALFEAQKSDRNDLDKKRISEFKMFG